MNKVKADPEPPMLKLMKQGGRMDKIDRRITSLLQENPKLTQAEIAQALGIAQSSAGARIGRLRSSKLLLEPDLINYEILGMSMCRVEVDTTNPEALLEWCQKCPLFVNSAPTVGSTKVCLFLIGEDLATFHSIINHHIGSLDGVRNYEMSLLSKWARPFYLKLDLQYSNLVDPPCGMLPYCQKCPMNAKYDGDIWNNQRIFREVFATKLNKDKDWLAD